MYKWVLAYLMLEVINLAIDKTSIILKKRKITGKLVVKKKYFPGGGMQGASKPGRSSSDWAIRVQALAGDIVFCSWPKHFTVKVPLSTQVYK